MKRLLLLILLLIPLVAVTGCSGGRGDDCAKDADCGTNLSCQDLVCRSVEDIRFCSEACSYVGHCTAGDGAESIGECRARSDADCKRSKACMNDDYGNCIARNGFCSRPANTRSDCRRGVICSGWGLCTARDGYCQATIDADCKGSTACSQLGFCTAKDGDCVK